MTPSPRFSFLLSLVVPLACVAALPAQGIKVDWMPTGSEVVLNTDVARIVTSAGPMTIRGGVFVFRNVTIPRGTRVRCEGSNPLIFILAGRFRLDGELTLRGGAGQRVDTLRSANFPARGGRGVCTGGDGGAGSPNPTDRSFVGQTGYGPLQIPSFGGGGGRIACAAAVPTGSGGGGGVFTTAGDPWYKTKAGAGRLFTQQTGVGGWGWGPSRTLPGGLVGKPYFRDGNAGNNFLGHGIDLARRVIITGELTVLVGGSGGGGGGDSARSCASKDPNFINDDKGGGGGGGGGVLVIAAGGDIVIGPNGRMDADGGNGGGGAWAGSNNRGAGGGAGAGGMIVLYTKSKLDIEVQGETYANNDYRFPISADGGVGQISSFGGAPVISKYPPQSASVMDRTPAGGMGGMGLIQFMTPPGTNRDGTNTVFDENIILRRGTTILTGATKQRYLAWRGYPSSRGTWVDDNGRATNIGDKAGDFRPTPVLLPVF